jgi:hypothetical protein
MNLLNVRADVIWHQIVLVLVDLCIHIPESNAIYLVDWKRGRMTLVSVRIRWTTRLMDKVLDITLTPPMWPRHHDALTTRSPTGP